MRRLFRTLFSHRQAVRRQPLVASRPARLHLQRQPRLCTLEDRTTPVTALIVTAPNVLTTGGISYAFDVAYNDPNGILDSSIGTDDVEVFGGNGSPITISTATPNATGNPTDVTVTYTFTPPGGQWDLTNRGAYGINWKANSVSDNLGPTPFPAADEFLDAFAVVFRDANGKFEVSEATSVVNNDWSTGKVTLEEATLMSGFMTGADTIDFSTTTFNSPQTITLSYDPTADLMDNFIFEDLTINGPGSAKLTLNADDTIRRDRRFFWMNGGTGNTITVNISGFTLANADVGFNTQGQSFINSAIYAANTNLTLSDMAFSKNTAGFGGAVFMDAGSKLSASSCTFDENWSVWDNAGDSVLGGGAISTQSDGVDITVTNCTFTGNSVDNVLAVGGGGAISFFGNGKLTVTNATFTNNSADGRGGAIMVGGNGAYAISSVTFNGNNGSMGGAIYTQSSASTVVRTIDASNFTGNFAVDRGGAICTFDPQQLTVTNSSFSNNSALTTYGGAVYGQSGTTADVRTFTGCTFTNNFAASVGGAICDFSPDQLKVNNSTFTTNTASTSSGGAIYVQGSDSVNIASRDITGSTFTGNSSGANGGAFRIVDNSNVSITNSTFTNNSATAGNGGAVSFGAGAAGLGAIRSISGSTFNGNFASDRGGALSDFDPDQMTISNSSFTANIAGTTYGGAFYSQGGDATIGIGLRTITNTTFTNNTATSVGGGLAELGSNSFSMSSVTFTNNTSTGERGGGVYFQGGIDGTTVRSIANSKFDGNRGTQGGGLYVIGGGEIKVNGSQFINNAVIGSATSNLGAGVFMTSGTTATIRSFTDTMFDNNVSAGGSGMFATGDQQLTLTRVRFSANTATLISGGGLAINGLTALSSAKIDSSLFVGNKVITAGQSGGAIGLATTTAAFAGPVTIINTTITGNSSATNGGAIRGFGSFTGVLTIRNSTIAGNTSAGNGAINMNNVNTVIESTILSDNVAGSNPDMTGTYASVKYSLVQNKGTSTWTVNSNNITGVSAQLNPLANNGGPLQTMSLKSTSPAIDKGINSTSITLDARGATRTQDDLGIANAPGGDGTDIGAVETNVSVGPPPTITSVKIDTGTGQRSLIRSIVVTFSENIDFVTTPAAAFDLQRLISSVSPGPTGAVTLAFLPVTGPTSTVTITFNDVNMAPAVGTVKSLIDGLYQLKINGSQIKSSATGQLLDGDNNTTPGGDATVSFHRLFGDVRGSSTTDLNGNGFTDNVDLIMFRNANGSDSTMVNYDETLDVNGDGFVDNVDLIAFRNRIGSQP